MHTRGTGEDVKGGRVVLAQARAARDDAHPALEESRSSIFGKSPLLRAWLSVQTRILRFGRTNPHEVLPRTLSEIIGASRPVHRTELPGDVPPERHAEARPARFSMVWLGNPAYSPYCRRKMSEARSPITAQGAMVLPVVTRGSTEPSAIRRAVTP